MKGVLKTPDGKRPHPPRNRRNRREAPKGRGCETLAGMKGWRPSAIQKRLETGSGSFAGEFLPDIGSIGLSLSAGLGAFAPRNRSSLSRNEASRPPSRTKKAPKRPRS